MSIFLTLLSLALAGVLFFYPSLLEERFLFPAQVTVLVLLALVMVADLIARLRRPAAAPVPQEAAPAAAIPPSVEQAVEAGVVQFLARLQEKGRLVDFALEDMAPYSNEQIGAAARVVHQGCREVLGEAFTIRPLYGGEEGEPVRLSGEYDASAYRLVGKVPEQPPYRGRVLHRGWRTERVKLPRVTETARKASAREIIAPAEVEIE